MKRKEQLFGVLLSLMLMLVLMAGMSAAAHAETTYPVWVGGVQVTSANMGNVLAGDPANDGKVSYTPATYTTPAKLTLNGATITGGSYNNAGIYAEDNLTINVTADSTVTGPDNSSGNSYGVYIYGSRYNLILNITGHNRLTIAGGVATGESGSSYGVYAQKGSVTVNGELTTTGGTSENGSSYGVYTYEGAVTVEVGAIMTAAGGMATGENRSSYGVYANYGYVTVSGKLDATGGTATNGRSYGILAVGNVTVEEGGMLTAAGGTTTNASSYGVQALGGTVTVNGTLTATGGWSGISASNVDVTVNGKLDATGNMYAISGKITNAISGTGWMDAAGTEGMELIAVSETAQSLTYEKVMFPVVVTYPVWVGGTQVTELNAADVLGDGKVNYTPAVTSENSTPAKLTLNGAYIVSTGSTGGDESYKIAAIYAEGDLTIHVTTDSTVTGVIHFGSSYYGIHVSGSLTVTGSGTLNATGGTANSESYGVYAENGFVTVAEGATLVATGNDAVYCCGVYAAEAVTVNGTLTAEGGEAFIRSCGVYASNGDVTVNGTLTAEGGTATDNDGLSCGVYADGSVTVNGTLTAASGEATGNYAASYGVYAENGAVTVEATGTLTATGGTATGYIGRSYGVYTENRAVTVAATAKLTATGGEADTESCGVYTEGGSVTVNGELTATGGTATNGSSYGVFGKGSVIVAEGGTLTAAAAGTANSYGVYTFRAVNVNGTLTAEGNTQAISGRVKNAIAGTGWTNTAGTEGKANIAVSTDGQTLEYKKDLFPGLPAATVTTAPTAKPLTCTGSAQELVNAGTASGGKMQYSLDGTSYSADIPTGTDAGTYNVWYKVVGDANHNDSAAAYIDVTISEHVPVTGVTLDKTNAQTIDVDDTVSFTASIEPENATDKTVLWSVSGTNTDAVALYSDEDCTVPVGTDATEILTVYAMGVSAGSATVTVTSNADNTKTASCAVTVIVPVPYGTPDFILPGAIRTIGANAFEGGAMKVVYISDNCTAIGAGAFKNCENLTQIRLPRDCAINDTAFDGCGTVYVFAAAGGTTESWCQGKDNIIFVRLEY